MKSATIQEETPGCFALQYEDTLGRALEMRLDADTYEGALREARAFLGINKDGVDEAGDSWSLE